jgi:parvulin-like peptidyl-prolyl isomerase
MTIHLTVREMQRKELREVKEREKLEKEKERERIRLEMEKRRNDPLLSRK